MKTIFYEINDEDKINMGQFLSHAELKDCVFSPLSLNPQTAELAKNAEAVCVFVESRVNQTIINSLSQIKLICTRSTGFDHIDTTYAKSKNISVANVPAYGSRTVAEFTFALILGLSRKTFLAYRQIKDRHDFAISGFEGFNLQGKTLGVVGTGRIGQNVMAIAKGFDMEILGFDAFPKKELEQTLGFRYVALNELLANSDIVTLHVPYSKDTHHLINQDNIKSLKPGAMLINTARGEVADTEAVLYGLRHKILSAAGLDVVEGEMELKEEAHLFSENKQSENLAQIKMLLADHILMDLPQVALTPHIAFFTKEAKKEIARVSVENIRGFFTKTPQNLVN